METFQSYLDEIKDEHRRRRVEDVLAWVIEAYPQLGRRIAWNQPMFTDHGTFIIGFSVAAGHLAVAPEHAAMIVFADELKAKKLNPTKMLFRFRWDQEIDYDLLGRIIAFNIEDKKETKTFWRH